MSRLRGGGGCVRGRCVREAEGRVEGSAEGHQERRGWRDGCQRSSCGQLQGGVCFEKVKSVDSIRLKMAGTMARKGGNARMWECVEERARGMDTVPEPSACRLCALGSLPEALVGVVEVSCLGIACMGCGVEWKGMLRDSRSEGD